MQRPMNLYSTICAAGITALSMTSPALGHDREPQSSYRHHQQQAMSRYDESQNLAPTQFFTQAERDLVARVQDNLQADPVIAPLARNLTVDADVGTVTLSGTLPTPAEKERALKITENVLGVDRVSDRIRVTNSASAAPATTSMTSTTMTRQQTQVMPGSVRTTQAPLGTARQAESSFPATGHRGIDATGDPALIGSGQMAEEDRTGSTGPSGSRNTSPLTSGAVDTIGRVAKPAGDYAVTEVDRGLASQIRLALTRPDLSVTEQNVHLVVDNGYVTLQGWVPTEQDRLAVASRVQAITGVQGVNNELRVGTHSAVMGQR